jgi:hypothetical protein
MLKEEDRLMAKFNLDNYETVGRISTDVVHITDDGSCVTIKAEIFVWHEDVGLYCVATGIRALANWKYQGSDKARPSREEMSKVQVEKKPVKKPTKQEQEAMNKVVDEMVAEPTNTTSDVGKQLNQLLEAMIPDEALRQTIKGNAYNELVNNGIADKDIKSWTKENMDVFMTRAEDMLKMLDNNTTDDSDLVEEVFGEVTASVVRTCPECNSPDWIEDNREKKASDERFAKIPSWSCSTYQGNNGCGWTAWGDTDCPKEWL